MPLPWKNWLTGLTALLLAGTSAAAEVHVAVAANFAAPMTAIAAILEKTTGHKAVVSLGATGKFYAQIRNGAPFDVLLAADLATPQRLEREGLAVAGTRLVYATGQLALWSAQPGYVDAQGQVLRTGSFRKLAMAEPRLAPYGAAAVETLKALGLMERLAPRLVTGESIGQAWSFVATGNAELGFVALAQVMEGGRLKDGSAWIVPAGLHPPIEQAAVVLVRGRANPAAAALMTLLRDERTRTLIRSYGYRD